MDQDQLKQVLQFAYEKGYDENISLQELLREVAELLEPFLNVQALS